MVAGNGYTVVPHSDSEEDKRAAKIVEEALDYVQGFTDARINQADAIFLGSSYAFIEGERRMVSLAGGPPRNWWVPTGLRHVDRRRFRLKRDREAAELRWQLWSVERERWEWLDHPEWFLKSFFEKTESTLGYGRGLLDTLYYFQASKARCIRDAMRASERFGQGFIKAAIENIRGSDGRPVAVQGRDSDSIAGEWKRVLKSMAAEDFLVHDARDKIDMLNGIGEGFGLLKALIDYFDSSQVMTVLGAVVNTMKPEGGSYALAAEQSNSTDTIIKADRCRQGEDLSRDVVGSFWRHSFQQLREEGLDGARPPKVVITNEKKESPQEAASLISTLLGAGVDLRADEVYERTGFTRPGEGDEIVSGAAAAAPAPGLEGLGFGERGSVSSTFPGSKLKERSSPPDPFGLNVEV
jgi:phage gp29-like protein